MILQLWSFHLRQRILHIILPPLDLFAWLKVSCVRFQGGAVLRSCVMFVVGFLTHIHVSKSGVALKWLGVVLEFEGGMSTSLIVRYSPLSMQARFG